MSNVPAPRRDLRLSDEGCYYGPNMWSAEPALVRGLAIAPEHAARLAEGAARLSRLSRDWVDDSMLSLPGIPSEEMIGKVVAWWARGALNEVRGYLHEAGAEKTAQGVTLWVGFHHPKVTGLAIELAVHALVMAANREDFSADLLKTGLEQLWQFCRRHHPDYQARILMTAARQSDIPVLPFVPGTKYWQYGWGARSRVFMESLSNGDGSLAGQLARNKPLSKSVFTSLGVPTPRHVVISEAGQLEAAASAMGFPCVVKPLDMGGGKGVTADIRDVSQLHVAFEHARRVTSRPLMVEQFVSGDDHRLMVVKGKLVGALRREASSVVGDGDSTVRQLIGVLNAARPDNLVKSRYLLPVAFDDVLGSHLGTQQVGLDTVLPAGSRITLRSNSNLSTGGIAVDVTHQVHPQIASLAEQLAVTAGLEIAGLDYLTTDITRSPLAGNGAFIEMNTTPGLDLLIAAGWTDEQIGALALGELPGRIPVDLCLTATLDLEAARLQIPAHKVHPRAAWVCGNQVRVGQLELRITDPTPWAAVQSALRNKTVESLQIVCTVEEILAHGLPVDRLDRVLLCGTSLPDRWRSVIERCAGLVEIVAH